MRAIGLITRGYVLKPCPSELDGPVTEVVVTVDPQDLDPTVEVDYDLEVSVVVC